MEGYVKIGEDLYRCRGCGTTYCGYLPMHCSCGNQLHEDEDEIPVSEIR